MVKKLFRKLVVLVSSICASVSMANAEIVNLGFAIDESGSVGSNGFALQIQGLAAALANIPTTGDIEYRIGVVAFSSGARTLIPPTIVTAANIGMLQTTLLNATFGGGGTAISAGLNLLVSDFNTAGATAEETTLFNVTTDGLSGLTADIAAAAAAIAAGVDSISAECIIVCASELSAGSQNLLSIVSPSPGVFVTDPANLPNPLQTAFVLQVGGFEDYADAIDAKIGLVVDVTSGVSDVPIPAALPLFISAIGAYGFAARRRRRQLA